MGGFEPVEILAHDYRQKQLVWCGAVVYGLPVFQKVKQRLWLIYRRRIASLVFVINTMTGSADADLAGLEGNPDTFTYDAHTGRVR